MSANNFHPLLHEKLKHFSFLSSLTPLIGTNESTITFLEEINLIPSRNFIAPQCCNMSMKVEEDKNKKLNWIWRCSTKSSKKKKVASLVGQSKIQQPVHFLMVIHVT